MNKRTTLFVAVLLVTTAGINTALASEEAEVDDALIFRWDKPTLDLLASGSAERGAKLSKKAKCTKCHGDTGVSDEDDTPSVAGQIAGYTYKQLLDYKEKVRDSKAMYKRVKKLSKQDLADLAAWYAIQTPEPMANPEAEVPELVGKGDSKRLLLACAACHGKEGEGKKVQTPLLAGQKIEYLGETLTAFKEGDRANDLYGRMRQIAQRLTDEEIETLAEFYAAAPAEEDEDE